MSFKQFADIGRSTPNYPSSFLASYSSMPPPPAPIMHTPWSSSTAATPAPNPTVSPTWRLPQRSRGYARGRRGVDMRRYCQLCDVSRSSADWDSHLQSKEHLKRLHERQQSAVMVTGVPNTVGEELIELLFTGFKLSKVDPITWVPASQDTQPFWHVQFDSVDDAHCAAQLDGKFVGPYIANISLCVQPFRCDVCNMNLNSDKQFQQHIEGTKHKQALKYHIAKCGLIIAGLPIDTKESEIRELFSRWELDDDAIFCFEEPPQEGITAYVTFSSADEAALALASVGPNISVRGTIASVSEGSTGVSPPQIQNTSGGEKSPIEVRQLLSALLHSRGITDPNQCPLETFAKACSLLLSSRPPIWRGIEPKERFFKEFEMQSGSKQGRIRVEQAWSILNVLDKEWRYPLPPGGREWLHQKMQAMAAKEEGMLGKGSFAQVRNQYWTALQTTKEIYTVLNGNGNGNGHGHGVFNGNGSILTQPSYSHDSLHNIHSLSPIQAIRPPKPVPENWNISDNRIQSIHPF